jgi:thioredoxin-related protein
MPSSRGILQTLLLILLVLPLTTRVAGEEPVEGTEPPGSITWVGYNEALALARDSGKPVFIHFTAPWCKWCVKMKKETYTDQAVISYLDENYVSVIVDTEKMPSLARKYQVSSLPTLWFLNSKAEGLTAVPGYMGPDTLLPVLEYIATEAYEEIEYEAWKRRRNKN